MGGTAQARVVATQFPQAFGLAESWDPEALRIVGDTTGVEARVYNARRNAPKQCGAGIVMRAPLVDLGRDPRWGRTEESYGEDPYLVSALAKSFLSGLHRRPVRRLQGTDPPYLLAASTLKHWLGNNNETNRNTSSSDIDDRNLREYYGAVPRGDQGRQGAGIMTAYNKISGDPARLAAAQVAASSAQWLRRHGVHRRVALTASTRRAATTTWRWAGRRQSAAEVIKSGQLLCGGNVTNNKPDDVEALRRAYTMNLITVADIDAALRGTCASASASAISIRRPRALQEPDRRPRRRGPRPTTRRARWTSRARPSCC